MTINISDNNPRISYTATSGQTAFTVPFVFFNDADLNVYINDTLKTITTDYTVTGGDGSTGSITLTSGATSGDIVVITRDVALERTTDFPSSGPFQVASLNTELDTIIAMVADMEDLAERGLRLSDSDTSASLVLADKDARKGTVLAFNATTGAVEVGPTIADTETIASIKADIATLADIEDGTDATDAIQTVAGISSNVTTVAGISSDVTTVAGNNANVTTVAGNDANITTVAGISANVTTVAGISSDVTSVAGDATDIGTVASNIADVNTVADNDANITTVAGQTTNMQNITDNLSAVQNAATNATNAATSASNASTSESNAAASAASAAASFDAFDDRYLGAKPSDPATDNDGDALDAGDQYFNTTDNELKVYNGSAWQSASVVGGTVTSLTTSSLDANGGTIDGTVIGGTTPAAGTFTTLTMDDSTVVFRMQESDVTDQSTMLRNLGGDFKISAMDSNGDPGLDRFIIDQATGDIKFSTTGGTGLHWDYADASLGIGTTSPSYTLDTLGSGAVVAQFKRDASGGASGGIRVGNNDKQFTFYVDNSNGLTVYDGSTERLAVDTSGNLLVSTSSDFASGTVDGIIAQGTAKPAAAFSNTTDGQVVKFYQGGNLLGSIFSSGGQYLGIGNDDVGLLFLDAADDIRPWNTSTNAARDNAIDLGNSDARFKDLYLGNSAIISANSGNSLVELKRANTNTTGAVGAISFTASDTHSVAAIDVVGDGDNEGGHIRFLTTSAASDNYYINSTTERLRIDSSGFVGIKEDSPSSYYAKDLVVKSNVDEGGITIRSNTTNATSYLMFADGTSGDARYRGYLQYTHASPEYMNIVSKGYLRFYTGETSGERLRILSGGGITFNGDTAQANALDDYEEGSWTPASPDGTITVNGTPTYVKIGKMVFVQADITMFTSSSGTQAKVDGLPYAVDGNGTNSQYNLSPGEHTYGSYITMPAIPTTDRILFRPNGGTSTSYSGVSGKRFRFSGWYETT